MKNLIIVLALSYMGSTYSQIKSPQASPTGVISQTVGVSKISVEYSRPGAKNREIFGGLVPYGKVWRTGANKATKITFEENTVFGGKKVKKGDYSLFTVPGKEAWNILLNSETELWGTGDYKEENEVCNITLKPVKTEDFTETFTIEFGAFNSFEAEMILKWANTKVVIPVKSMSKKKIEKQYLDLLVEGPSANSYYNGARFFLENELDMNLALEWVNKAISKREDAFWMQYRKACILEKLDRDKEAIATAKDVIKIAKEKEDDYGYIRKSEKLIEDIKSK